MIKLTENAVKHVKKQLEKRGAGVGLHIGLKRTGCSGYSYTFQFVDEPLASASETVQDGVTVFIKPEDEFAFANSTLDYVKRGFQEAFEFSNPNEKARCGCGESVSI
jgi:iron-sulfur cluster assembly protein